MPEQLHQHHIYEPRPIEQDLRGCEVAALTNVAAVLDGDLSSFDKMCEQLGRAPGAYLTTEQKYRWALEKRQYTVRHISPFSDERLKNEGAEYAVQHYSALQRYFNVSF